MFAFGFPRPLEEPLSPKQVAEIAMDIIDQRNVGLESRLAEQEQRLAERLVGELRQHLDQSAQQLEKHLNQKVDLVVERGLDALRQELQLESGKGDYGVVARGGGTKESGTGGPSMPLVTGDLEDWMPLATGIQTTGGLEEPGPQSSGSQSPPVPQMQEGVRAADAGRVRAADAGRATLSSSMKVADAVKVVAAAAVKGARVGAELSEIREEVSEEIREEIREEVSEVFKVSGDAGAAATAAASVAAGDGGATAIMDEYRGIGEVGAVHFRRSYVTGHYCRDHVGASVSVEQWMFPSYLVRGGQKSACSC